MFGAIGESAVHQIPRGGGFSSGTEQDVVVQKAEQIRQARPVENSGDSGKPKADSQDEETLKNHNRLEERQDHYRKIRRGRQTGQGHPAGVSAFWRDRLTRLATRFF